MAVYFKFKSAKDFDSVSIDGHFISVANLKEKIVEQKKLGRGSDYDLVISNAQTNEEYTDEGFLVPKNTSVIVRRVPGRPRMPIVADVKEERKPTPEIQPVKNGPQYVEPFQKNLNISSVSDGLDDFGIDLYAVPEIVQASTASLTEEEDNKIKAFVDASASDWQRQTQESFAAGRGYGNKGQGRGLPLRGYGNGRGFEKKNPPHGYVCHRCGVTGHYIQHCPTNGDPTYDIKKVKPPTGIPKTMLVANPDGSYALPTGEVAVLKPNEAVFEREVDGLPSSSRPLLDIPSELCCPLCKGVLKEAVLTSKCCFKSYCDKCIRHEIISKARCVCGAKNILADDLLPNRTLRDAISRFLESQASAATSSGNVGSRLMLQDMESAPFVRVKMQSPAVSISLKEASSALMPSDGSDTKEPFTGSKGPGQTQGEASAVSGTVLESTSGRKHTKEAGAAQVVETADGSPESQLTKEPVQELNSDRQARSEVEHREQMPQHIVPVTSQGRAMSEPMKGKKKTKGKRLRQQVDMTYSEGGMWGPNPNYNAQAEMGCQNCGSYDHPAWNCYMNGPGPSHYPPPMQGPMFNPVFSAPMRGMMHQPMGDGYMMPYHHNPGPYNGYGPTPYEMPFNAPMVPHESFAPHAGMMQCGPPMPRDYADPMLMSRDEFEARKAELKRRREREQRFGREQVKYPTSEGEPDCMRANGRLERRPATSGRERELSPDLVDEHTQRVRPHQSMEQGRYSGMKSGSRQREDWTEKNENLHSSDGEGSAHQDSYMGKRRDRWSSRHVEEASSGDEVSEGGRYARASGESYHAKHRERGHTTHKASGDGTRDSSLRSDHKADYVVYDSEEETDVRRHSGSQVGPSSPLRHVRRKPAVDEQSNRDQDVRDGHYKEINMTRVHAQDGRSSKAHNSREGTRGSVFERTNLPVKPKRVVEDLHDEYAEMDERDRSKRNSRMPDHSLMSDRRVDVDRLRDSDDNRQYAGSVSRKRRRAAEDLL
ncbi:E3 ubiquitin-protein ligase RBBP6 [Marchantia polymorpha subsp. ruderalis]|uniref:DWNN domain-containing protein n=2 Tax=Marchantia polymorpha TaxID=3197 RepID=A0A176VWV4_MARPO|nr:hypothetical protein AXG93_4620s1120 [Marchantia polymorpha subsp. ruderalis]PTQ43618.1 hypothetical protein MARPO_0024s0115 [Marchantia polymorpha]BBN06720.1 hypothetical protein Mp_3g23390 [Marchantia polymorpha subsp. ruderalis]|eukprot:PTQ43618.1 hypothetical protein MARPO_0024s0115 [Marchantia polymorpha]